MSRYVIWDLPSGYRVCNSTLASPRQSCYWLGYDTPKEKRNEGKIGGVNAKVYKINTSTKTNAPRCRWLRKRASFQWCTTSWSTAPTMHYSHRTVDCRGGWLPGPADDGDVTGGEGEVEHDDEGGVLGITGFVRLRRVVLALSGLRVVSCVKPASGCSWPQCTPPENPGRKALTTSFHKIAIRVAELSPWLFVPCPARRPTYRGAGRPEHTLTETSTRG